MLTYEQFVQNLRDALNHLYDPHRLRRNPLAILFHVEDRPDAPTALRKVLTEAIASLKPTPDVPPQARARRIYELLLYRYVQQFSQQEVADQLGLSVRHLRREQAAALDILAARLWEQISPDSGLPGEASSSRSLASHTSPEAPLHEELAWLQDAPVEQPASLPDELTAVLNLASSIATQHEVHLETALEKDLPQLPMHAVALRQMLLGLLTVAIHRAPGGIIHVSAHPHRWEIEIRIVATTPRPGPRPVMDEDVANLDIVQRLVDLCGGRLELLHDPPGFTSRLILPALEQLPVLAIDDNADTLQLLQRYVSGTRYHLIGVQDPEEAFPLAEQCSPQIIVLDVMMPHTDGWEMLGRLRQHPATGRIPIIVCTILAQEELALSLGASGFVRKPLTRQTFLAALDQQIAWTTTASR